MLQKSLFTIIFTLSIITANAQYTDLAYASIDVDESTTIYSLNKNYKESNFSTVAFNNALRATSRHPMEKTGRILTFVGVPLAIIGGIMVSGADSYSYECVNGDCVGDAKGAFGAIFLGAGIGLSATGGILWAVGSKK